MKKTVVAWLWALVVVLCLAGCGGAPAKETAPPTPEPTPKKSRVEQIDEQLQGSWKNVSNASAKETVFIYTFNSGRYVAEIYIEGEKFPYPSMGNYAIGTDSIHTVTIDQEKSVEGEIPFTFEDGVLRLLGATGELFKMDE